MKRQYTWLTHLLNFLSVILGVYLAFYINEKAKANQDRKESLILMTSLVNDLSADIKTYEKYQIPVNVQYQQSVEGLLNSLVIDSLEGIEAQLSAILGIENYAPTNSTYSSMKSSGKLSLIEDLTLQKALADYYEGLVIECEKKGQYQVDYFTDELLTWFTSNVDLLEMKIIKKNELILLRNKLVIYGSLIAQKVETYEKLVEHSKELKLRIESILNSE